MLNSRTSQDERLKFIEKLNLMLSQNEHSNVSKYLINKEIKTEEFELVVIYLKSMERHEKVSSEEIELCKNILSKYKNDIKDLNPNQSKIINNFLLINK